MPMNQKNQFWALVTSVVMIVGGALMIMLASQTTGRTVDFIHEEGQLYDDSIAKSENLGYPMNDIESLKAGQSYGFALDVTILSIMAIGVVFLLGAWFLIIGMNNFVQAFLNKPTIYERLKALEQNQKSIVDHQERIIRILEKKVVKKHGPNHRR
jgi:hypothetical protein